MRRILGLCCLLLLGLTGCGFFVPQTSSGGTTNTGDFLYVGNGNNTFIAGFGVSSSGALSVLPSSPYNNSVAAQSLAVTPSNTFLYAGTTNGIYVYAINTNGSITVQNSGASAAQDVIATAMQVDSTGNYLLAAGISTSLQAQAIAIYQIDATTGLLTALTGSSQSPSACQMKASAALRSVRGGAGGAKRSSASATRVSRGRRSRSGILCSWGWERRGTLA